MQILHSFDIISIEKDINDLIVVVRRNDVEERLSASKLVFSDDLEVDAEDNPSLEVVWSNMSSMLQRMLTDQEQKIEEFVAYYKRFLKWYLKGKGEKDTIEGRNEGFYTIFGKNVGQKELYLAVAWAFKGYCEERKQNLNLDEWNLLLQWADGMTKDTPDIRDFREFSNLMLSGRNKNIFYDELIKQKHELEEAFLSVDAVAKGFNQKGVLIASMLSGRRGLVVAREKLFTKIKKEDNL